MNTEPSANTRRKIVITKNKFDSLKTKGEFWALVALSRAVNELRFVQMPLISHQNDNSPAAIRARYNSLLFSCALFVESYLLVQKLNKYFGHMPLFQELAQATSKNKVAQQLLNVSLFDLRNRLVFHFGIDEFGEQLKTLELSEPIFVSAMGKENGQVYYELADLCAARAFSKPLPKDDAAALAAIGQRTEEISDLIVEFSERAEKLIVEVLTQQGWQSEILA